MQYKKCGQELVKDMLCQACGYHLPDDSAFCMNCGCKVVHNSCGAKQKYGRGMLAAAIVILVALVTITILGIKTYFDSLKSPIEGVSQRVYSQGQEYLELMETSIVQEKVITYASKNSNVSLNEIYKNVEDVDFHIDLGNNPTEEEIYYADLIIKFWESWAICYAHEGIIAGYEDGDETAIQMVASMHKGIVSGFKDDISEAKGILKRAKDMSDMKVAYKKLKEIWGGDKK